MLTATQKRFLRKEAHNIQPIFQVGKRKRITKLNHPRERSTRSKRIN